MSFLYYHKNDGLLISDEPNFPSETHLNELSPSEGEYLTVHEWKTYFVKFVDKVPDNFKKAPFITKRFESSNVYEINFKNYVGLTRIGNLDVKVQNNKIGDELYDSILESITQKYANLIFSFNKSVGLEYRKDKIGEDIAFLQYIFLKTYLLDQSPNIDEISNIILSNPHKKLYSKSEKCMINEWDSSEASSFIDSLLRSDNLALLSSGHPLASTVLAQNIYRISGKRYYPIEAKRIRKFYTSDTNENRFILFFLKRILQLLNYLNQAIGDLSGTYLNPDISTNIEKMKKKISYFLSQPIWNDVGTMQYIPTQSTILHKRDGYRHLFQLYSLLQLSTRYQFLLKDFRNIIEIKDVATLYEYWCFFQVKNILDKQYNPLNNNPIIQKNDKEQRLNEGLHIKYDGPIDLYYNYSAIRSYGVDINTHDLSNYRASESYSHLFRPDIVIINDNKSKLILDAKYKGRKNNTGFYGHEDSDGAIIRYKEEDLDKMHTYREAIDNVAGAFALYPGNEFIIYPAHNADKVSQGVGALPLKPNPNGQMKYEHLQMLEAIISDFIGV